MRAEGAPTGRLIESGDKSRQSKERKLLLRTAVEMGSRRYRVIVWPGWKPAIRGAPMVGALHSAARNGPWRRWEGEGDREGMVPGSGRTLDYNGLVKLKVRRDD
jgi:hypothetical protein